MVSLSSEEKFLEKRLGKGTRLLVCFSSGKVQQTLSFLIERSVWTHLMPTSI